MKGVIAAVPTPLNSEGAPDKDMFVAHCQAMLAGGCDGLNILGSTGEANSIDNATRREIMSWAAKSCEISRLMVGTGTPSLAETIALTCYADDLGYAVALVLPPYYYKPVSEEGLFSWYAALNDGLAGRSIQIYFYNYPQMTGLVISPAVMARLNAAWPARFTGVKDSSGDLEYCCRLCMSIPGFAVFPSAETSLAVAAKSGFSGCISATVNQTASLSARLWQLQAEGKGDADLVRRIGDIRAQIAAESLIPSIKYLVAKHHGWSNGANVLPPFEPLSETRRTALGRLAKDLNSL